jgi:hypothetical protein
MPPSTNAMKGLPVSCLPWIIGQTNACGRRCLGFDHGVGHPLLLLCHAKAPNYLKKKAFKDLAYYSEWPTR